MDPGELIMEAGFDPSNKGNDDGDDGAELLSAALDDHRADEIISILRKNPSIIHVADPAGDTVLHVAARAGNVVTIRNLIGFIAKRVYWHQMNQTGHMDVNDDGDTALHLARKNGHQEVAALLLLADSWVMCVSNKDEVSANKLPREAGLTAVLPVIPSYNRRSEMWSLGLESALADVELRAVKEELVGVTSRVPVKWNELCRAIDNGLEDVIAMGLKRDGEELLRYQDQQSRETLLHKAVRAVELTSGPLKQLIEYVVANSLTYVVWLQDRDGDTAVHLAVRLGQHRAASCLISAAPWSFDIPNNSQESPVSLAVKDDRQDFVKHIFQIVSQSLDFDAIEIRIDPKHGTLAHLAIKSKAFSTLQTLMENQPELINMTNERGWRPLSYAANKGYLDGVTYLLTCFPDSTEKYDRDGSLPLHKAVGGGQVNIIQAFLSHCPQALHHVDKNGRSVFHVAVRYAKADILAYLTKDIDMDDPVLTLKDNEGKTFMDYANELRPS